MDPSSRVSSASSRGEGVSVSGSCSGEEEKSFGHGVGTRWEAGTRGVAMPGTGFSSPFLKF